MRNIARTECAWSQYDAAYAVSRRVLETLYKKSLPPTHGFASLLQKAAAGSTPAEKAKLAEEYVLPARQALLASAAETMTYLLQTVTSRGELGTVRWG
jgi:hypothetical protein